MILLAITLAGCGSEKSVDEKVASMEEKTVNEKASDKMVEPSDKFTVDEEENKEDSHIEDNSAVENPSTNEDEENRKLLICIDPGHGDNSFEVMENIAPNSNEQKPGFAFGTRGVATGVAERDLNMEISHKLNEALKAAGFETAMTRDGQKSDMTNIARAEFGNQLNADLSVKIHANGSETQSTRGAMVLIPSGKYIQDQDMLARSRSAGQLILDSYIRSTGAYSLGLIERDDITGFNWSKIPVVLVEMGFMTNPEEDLLMASPEYQDKIVSGIVEGVLAYKASLQQ